MIIILNNRVRYYIRAGTPCSITADRVRINIRSTNSLVRILYLVCTIYHDVIFVPGTYDMICLDQHTLCCGRYDTWNIIYHKYRLSRSVNKNENNYLIAARNGQYVPILGHARGKCDKKKNPGMFVGSIEIFSP